MGRSPGSSPIRFAFPSHAQWPNKTIVLVTYSCGGSRRISRRSLFIPKIREPHQSGELYHRGRYSRVTQWFGYRCSLETFLNPNVRCQLASQPGIRILPGSAQATDLTLIARLSPPLSGSISVLCAAAFEAAGAGGLVQGNECVLELGNRATCQWKIFAHLFTVSTTHA